MTSVFDQRVWANLRTWGGGIAPTQVRKFTPSLLLWLLLLSSTAEAQSYQATIYRDAYGSPHVFAQKDADVLFGMAYALAEDDWKLIEENYVRALGRSAEREGQDAIARDWLARALEISRLSIDEYKRANARMQGLLEAYAAGLNSYVAKHPNIKPLFGRVEPWFPLALIRYKYYQLEFVQYAGLQRAMTARLLEHGWPVGKDLPRTSSAQAAVGHEQPFGSNQWALAPSRSASGNALLLINPHQSFVGVQRYGEIHVHSNEGLRFSGLTVFGFLLPYMGNNEDLGWAYTDNMADRGDLYAEKFDDVQQPLRYRYGKGYRDATIWTDTIRVLEDGRVIAKPYTFWKTHHGPVVGLADDNRPLTVRMARYEDGGWFDQWDAMIRARTMGEWKTAMARLNVAYMNTMYADRHGNIGYLYASAVPRRDTTLNYIGIVDGSDPRAEWQGMHSLDELPQVFNPSAGYLLNTNSTPFTATRGVPYRREQFPRYMIGNESDNARAISSRAVLESLTRVSFDQFASAVWDTRLSTAAAQLRGINEEWTKLRAAKATDIPAELQTLRAAPGASAIIDRLNRWDRRADINSPETTWFALMNERRQLVMRNAETRDWPWSHAMAQTVDMLQRRWGRADVPWGEINRLQRPLPDAANVLDTTRASLPVDGAASSFGSVFTFHTEPFGEARPRLGVHGNSFVKVIEFGRRIRSRSVLNFGQSGDPASPHFFDQGQLYAKRTFKEAWFDEADVKRNAKKSYVVSNR